MLFTFLTIFFNMDRWIGSFRPNVPFETGPDFILKFLIPITIGLLFLLLISQILDYKKTVMIVKNNKKKLLEEDFDKPIFREYILFITIVFVLIYIACLEYFGFILSSLFLLTMLQVILGNRNLWKIMLFSLGLITFCYFLFIKTLYISLPRGIGIFEKISYLFY